jgi:hypothetical protein
MTTSNPDDTRIIKFNRYQLLSATVNANQEFHIWPRGMGKSTGLISARAINNLTRLRKGTGVFVAPTFVTLLAKTLPPVLAGFDMFGWKEDKHYVIGKKPPAAWPKPYVYPRHWDYFISTITGSGIHLISQDRKGTSNGLSTDWHIIDEAKLINKKQYDDESIQTLRGNDKIFARFSEHGGRLFCTDQPTSPNGKWIYEYEGLMDKNKVHEVVVLERERARLLLLLQQNSVSEASHRTYLYKIKQLEKQLYDRRKNLVFYTEPKPIDVLQALGPKYVRDQKQGMSSDFLFKTSILNFRAPKVAESFYATFDDTRHTYDAYDYAYIDSFDYNILKLVEYAKFPDCRKDADINRSDKLYVAMDNNYSINNLVIGQPTKHNDHEFRILNHLFVYHPKVLKDLAHEFDRYYKSLPRKEIDYYWDHTAKQGRNAATNIIFYQEFGNQLRNLGWKVNDLYIGMTPGHNSRFEYFGQLFQEQSVKFPTIRINRNNCPHLITALNNAEARQTREGFEKNKKAETDTTIDQAETTHVTDAFDTLVYGKYYVKPEQLYQDSSGIIY